MHVVSWARGGLSSAKGILFTDMSVTMRKHSPDVEVAMDVLIKLSH